MFLQFFIEAVHVTNNTSYPIVLYGFNKHEYTIQPRREFIKSGITELKIKSENGELEGPEEYSFVKSWKNKVIIIPKDTTHVYLQYSNKQNGKIAKLDIAITTDWSLEI